MARNHETRNEISSGKLPENMSEKLADQISTGDFNEDSRNLEEILEERLKEFSGKTLKADILEMLLKHRSM